MLLFHLFLLLGSAVASRLKLNYDEQENKESLPLTRFSFTNIVYIARSTLWNITYFTTMPDQDTNLDVLTLLD